MTLTEDAAAEAPSVTGVEADLDRALRRDRHGFRRQLKSIKRLRDSGKPFDRNLGRLHEAVTASVARRAKRTESVPEITYDEDLPVCGRRGEIAEAIRENQVVVVCGETGSGKSTQLPKICLEMGRGIDGLIGHTQPRRIAARSIAARVAEELGRPKGNEVGFKIRFTDTTSPETYVKLMTDGVLLAETQSDRLLDGYDTIIVDEAHERSLNVDFLLGYLKRVLPRRRDLKVIVTSATIDAERFAEFFTVDAAKPTPIIEVSGRTYPVDLWYRPPVTEDEESEDRDVMQAMVEAVEEVAARDTGDVLIFQPTERDIRDAADLLRGRTLTGDGPGRKTEVVPLYGRLSVAEQNKAFAPHGHRRIVIATNVAESSITVPGIRYVIDTGTARISRYSPRSKVQRLPIEPVSRASADQRKGRCGRVGPGICVRLYAEDDYLAREDYTPPEVLRSNLAAVVLRTLSLGLGRLDEFPFIDPPKAGAIREGYRTLFELGAIDERDELTELGKKLSRMPVDPRIGRMIVAADEEGCLPEVLIIAAALEVRDPRERPIDKQAKADAAHEEFRVEGSDFLEYLRLWDFFHGLRGKLSRSKLQKACHQKFLSHLRMREWVDVHRQLRETIESIGLKAGRRHDEEKPDAIHRALLTGLLSNVALREEKFEYTGANALKLHLWPGSSSFEKKPKWIVAAELVETTRRYGRTVARIDPSWIEPLAGHLLKKTYSDPEWDAKSGSAMAVERVTLFGIPVVAGRRVRYGRVDAVKSREMFLYHGLVEGDHESPGEFQRHNRELLTSLEAEQAKTRQADFLHGEDARLDFFDNRVAAKVVDAQSFEAWRKKAEKTQPRLLFLSRTDLVADESAVVDDEAFPNAVLLGRTKLPLSYHLEPGTDTDGITLTVPREGLNQLDGHRLGWLVPGLIAEKVTALVKSLPKERRRAFVPAPDTAAEVVSNLSFGQGDVLEAVAAELTRIGGTPVTRHDFDLERLPRHLRMNVRVIDEDGEVVAQGRSVKALQRSHGTGGGGGLADERWNRAGITSWDVGDLPPRVDVKHGGTVLVGYPALEDAGDTVRLRLCDTPATCEVVHRGGVRRLFAREAGSKIRQIVETAPAIGDLRVIASASPGFAIDEQLRDLIADRAFFTDKTLPRTTADFAGRAKAGHDNLVSAAQDVFTTVTPTLEAWQAVRSVVRSAKAPSWQFAVDDVRDQLDRLFGPRSLVRTPFPWLQQFPRYLKAIELRLRKLAAGGLERDRKAARDLQPFLQCLVEAEKRPHQVRDPRAFTAYRWMIEEYRVSLFEQRLGTAVKVSPQRLQEQWAKVRG